MFSERTAAGERRELVMQPAANAEPEIGRWLWALEDTRQRTKRALAGLQPAVLDWAGEAAGNSIGTVLAHLAAIEVDWLYAEVLEQEIPAGLLALLPPAVRDEQGRLTQVGGESLDTYLARLDAARANLLGVFNSMSLPDFRRPRSLPNYDVTPEWVLHHLIQHEAEHRGEIGMLRLRAEQALAIL